MIPVENALETIVERHRVVRTEIPELEKRLAEARQEKSRLQAKAMETLCARLYEQSQQLAQRTSVEISASNITESDRRIISIYEENVDVAEIRDSLQEEYVAACARREKRERLEHKASETLHVDLLLVPSKGTFELYLPINKGTEKEELPLALSSAVAKALLEAKCNVQSHGEEEHITRLVLERSTADITDYLTSINPVGFAQANIELSLVTYVGLEDITITPISTRSEPSVTEERVTPDAITKDQPSEGGSVTLTEKDSTPPTGMHYLGEDYELYAGCYGEDVVEGTVERLERKLGKDNTTRLLGTTAIDSIFELDRIGVDAYVKDIVDLQKEATSLYKKRKDSVPEEFDLQTSPENFLPQSIANTRSNLTTRRVEIIAEDVGVEQHVVEGLLKEGHNPYYVHAMLAVGFRLGKDRPHLGNNTLQQESWIKEVGKAVQSFGLPFSPREVRKQMRRAGDIFYDPKGGDANLIALRSSWKHSAQGSIQTYLQAVMRRDRS